MGDPRGGPWGIPTGEPHGYPMGTPLGHPKTTEQHPKEPTTISLDPRGPPDDPPCVPPLADQKDDKCTHTPACLPIDQACIHHSCGQVWGIARGLLEHRGDRSGILRGSLGGSRLVLVWTWGAVWRHELSGFRFQVGGALVGFTWSKLGGLVQASIYTRRRAM